MFNFSNFHLQGCDNVIQSESDSEDENVDYASWQGKCAAVDFVKI